MLPQLFQVLYLTEPQWSYFTNNYSKFCFLHNAHEIKIYISTSLTRLMETSPAFSLFFARAENTVYLRKGFYETKIHAYTMSSTYIAPNCPCPEKECPRHRKCEECVKHHTEKGEDPYCAR